MCFHLLLVYRILGIHISNFLDESSAYYLLRNEDHKKKLVRLKDDVESIHPTKN